MTSSKLFVFILISCLSVITTDGSNNKIDDIASHIVRSLTTDQRQKVVVLDALFPESSMNALQTLLAHNSPWQIHNDEEFPNADIQKEPSKGEDLESSVDPECSREQVLWSVQIPTVVFRKFNIWKQIHECLHHITEVDKYLPYDIIAQKLRPGTIINTTCGIDTSYGQEYVLRLFLTSDEKKNDYGDLTLFRTDKVPDISGQVLLNVKPKYGRVVLWDASISYLSHPPSIGYGQELLFVTIRCTRDLERVKESQKKIESKLIERESSQFFRFPKLKKKPESKQDLIRTEVKRFQDKGGRVVAVFDDLFSRDDLDKLKMYVANQGPNFNFESIGAGEQETANHVKSFKIFEPEDFRYSELWKVIADVARYVSGNSGGWYPYDVVFNVGVPEDHTWIQRDCKKWENEYTFLMYLNFNWSADMFGETTFFDQLPRKEEISDELEDDLDLVAKSNSIGAVKPQYGRAVVYQGAIPHSVTRPSSAYQGMQLSFAVKMAATRKIAIAKRLQQKLEDYPGDITEAEEDLLEELLAGAINGEHSKRSEKWLMEQLNQLVLKTDEYMEILGRKATKILLTN